MGLKRVEDLRGCFPSFFYSKQSFKKLHVIVTPNEQANKTVEYFDRAIVYNESLLLLL